MYRIGWRNVLCRKIGRIAIAYSGSQRDPSNDASKGREFWEWWLDEAVKNAWWTFDDD
ncbi:MAG: hypothetical protein GDA56_02780 [Hormoscilla sp. GM7CHS1pb]|nr:hypothetical protein [Hormoscilla sp. GM7CHS1pb]